MSEESINNCGRDTPLDRAAEEYLRECEAGAAPSFGDLAGKYGVSESDIKKFVSNHRWFSERADTSGGDEVIASPSVVKAFGDFELQDEPLGRGGMGVVYKARQVSLDRIVAVKLIVAGALASPPEIRRFYEEARMAARLQHPNIVAIHDVGRFETQHYYSMDFVDGQTLDDLINAQGPLPPRIAAEYLLASAKAVAYAHHEGIIHRDLKPSNIVIDVAGQPRLTDFGLAKQRHGDSQVTETLGVLGTPSYMAPEQARGDNKAVDERTDVYGLGAVLYKALTGIPPFQGASPLDIFNQVVWNEPIRPRSLNAETPVDLETICLKCLRKVPSFRYATAAALAEDLARYLAQERIEARPVGRLQRLNVWARRRPWVAGLSALLILAICGGGIGISMQYLRAETALQDARANLARAESNLSNAVEALDFVGREIGEVELAAVPRVQQLQRRILERAVEFNEFLLASNRDDRRARWESGWAHLRNAEMQTTLGNYEAAEGSYRRSMEILNSSGDGTEQHLSEKQQHMRAQYGLGNLLIDRQRFGEVDEIVQALRTAVNELPERSANSVDHLELKGALQSLEGRKRIHENRFTEAEALLRDSLATNNELIAKGGANPRFEGHLANCYLSLGLVLQKSGRSDDAIAAYRNAIGLFKKIGSEDRLATALRNLAIAYRKNGDLTDAIDAYAEARRILAALLEFSPESVPLQSEFAETAHGNALVCLEQQKIREAIPFLLEAVAAQKAVVDLAPKMVNYQLRLRNQTFALAETYRKARDHIRAAATLEDFLQFAVNPIDHVNAAVEFVECRGIATSDSELPEARRRELSDDYAMRSIQVLRSAKEKGLIDARFIRSDDRFAVLNAYDGFSVLLQAEPNEPAKTATTP